MMSFAPLFMFLCLPCVTAVNVIECYRFEGLIDCTGIMDDAGDPTFRGEVPTDVDEVRFSKIVSISQVEDVIFPFEGCTISFTRSANNICEHYKTVNNVFLNGKKCSKVSCLIFFNKMYRTIPT